MNYIRVDDEILEVVDTALVNEEDDFEDFTHYICKNKEGNTHYLERWKSSKEGNSIEDMFDCILSLDGRQYKLLNEEEKEYLKQMKTNCFVKCNGWYYWWERCEFFGAIFTEKGNTF